MSATAEIPPMPPGGHDPKLWEALHKRFPGATEVPVFEALAFLRDWERTHPRTPAATGG